MAFQPFQNELGKRAYEEICGVCWGEWLKMQQQLINHYGLNLRDPKAKEFLFRNMEQFLFKEGQVGDLTASVCVTPSLNTRSTPGPLGSGSSVMPSRHSRPLRVARIHPKSNARSRRSSAGTVVSW